jgi:glycosyltransferase involved in cell wall biosynthesis
MRIVHVIIGLGVGGAELMLKRLIEGLDGKDGMEHSVISLTEIGTVGHQLRELGVDVKALGMCNVVLIPKIFLKLRAELKRQNPDIVQTWMYHADFLGGLAARTLGIKNIFWNVRNTYLKGNGVGNYLFRKLCGLLSYTIPKHIIYVSYSAQIEHIRSGFNPKNACVIGNGFNTDLYKFSHTSREHFREVIGLESDDVAVFSVGRCVPAKDHKTFIQAICLARKNNKNIKGVLIGRGISLEVFDLTNEDKKGFIIFGETQVISEVLSAADIFCLHSTTEGFPNVLGEAMSVGLPCITTKAGDAELILANNKYVVDLGDSYSLGKLMIDLSYSKKRDDLGLSNRKKIIDNYSLDKILNIYQENYSRVYDESIG